MKRIRERFIAIISKTPMLVVIIIVFMLGYQFKGLVSTTSKKPLVESADNVAVEVEEEIWTCSMHPQIRLPEPGQCPLCGMDLIKAKGSSKRKLTATRGKKPKYACSMFCVPPLPHPGKCPICGMEMVEVQVDEASGEDAGESTLTLSLTAQKLAEIRTVPVQRKFVSTEIRMVGKVDYDETSLKYITAWVPGRLDRLFVDYTGVPVRKGDHLVYLYSPELATAQTELLEALSRTKPSRTGKDSASNNYAANWLEDIREKFRLWGMSDEQIAAIESRGTASEYMTIYAPMGGIVIHKNAVEGMYVQTGTRIYTIADLSRVWVKLDAYESDLAWLRYGQHVEFETEAYPGDTFTGKVAFIDPILNSATRTVKLRVNVDNADGRLKPGMFVRAVARSKVAAGGRVVDAELSGKWMCPMHPEIVSDKPIDCERCGMPLVRTESLGFVSEESTQVEMPLIIPASAPLVTGKRALVYVELPNKPVTYSGREVILGPRAGNQYIVLDGLLEGERIVTHGNFKIDSAMQIMAEPSMMSPGGGAPPPSHIHGGGSSHEMVKPETMPPEEHSKQHPVKRIDVPPSFTTELDLIVKSYLKIQQALSHDRYDETLQAAKELSNVLDAVNTKLLVGQAHHEWMKEAKGIANSTTMIAESSDINKAREAFALLSESMIVITQRFGAGEKPVHRFHCPMAFNNRGADWLQAATKTENPYFGSTMFRCGAMKATIGIRRGDVNQGGTGNE